MGNSSLKNSQSQNFLSYLSEPIYLKQENSKDQLIVYKNKNVPSQYIVKFTTPYNEQIKMKQYLKLLSELKCSYHTNIVKLFHFEVNEAQLVCNKEIFLNCYYSFYNFKLSQIIKRKYVRMDRVDFLEHEIWYIAHSLFSIIGQLEKYEIALGGLHSKQIFCTPDGQIKFYPNKLRQDNSHAGLFDVMRDLNYLHECYISPEQIKELKKGNFMKEYIFEFLSGGDVFSIGMVLLECLTYEYSSKFYSVKNMDIKYERLQTRLNLLGVEGKSKKIVDFLSHCLEINPKNRIKIKDAIQFLQKCKIDRYIDFMGEDKENNMPSDKQIKHSKTSSNVLLDKKKVHMNY